MSGIGHNRGPSIHTPDPAPDPAGMRLYAWRKAHRAAFRAPSVEALKIRTARANALGLTYRDFTLVLLDRGRNLTTLIFAFAGVLVRRMRPDVLMPGVRAKLAILRPGASFVFEEARERAPWLQAMARVGAVCGHAFTEAFVATQETAAGLAQSMLAQHGRVPAEAVLISDRAEHEDLGRRGNLALFVWAHRYFAETPDSR